MTSYSVIYELCSKSFAINRSLQFDKMSKTITDTELSEWQKFPEIVRSHRCFDLFREKLSGMS